ncbi:MAG: hypothetical protein WCT20_03675 [Candidatus Babeliales bacterium]|jgi:hypothetical protein
MFKRLFIVSLGTLLFLSKTEAALTQWAFMSPASNITCPLFQPSGHVSQNPTYISPMLPGVEHPDYSNGMDALKKSFADVLPTESVNDKLERILIDHGFIYIEKKAIEQLVDQGFTTVAMEKFRQYIMLTHHKKGIGRPSCPVKEDIIALNHRIKICFDTIRQAFGIQKDSPLSVNKWMLDRIYYAMYNVKNPFLDNWIVRFNGEGKELTEKGDILTLDEHDVVDIANGDFVYFPFYTVTETSRSTEQVQEVGAIIVGSSDPFQACVREYNCGYTPNYDEKKADFIIRLSKKLAREIRAEKESHHEKKI